jgi:hypothetical protein
MQVDQPTTSNKGMKKQGAKRGAAESDSEDERMNGEDVEVTQSSLTSLEPLLAANLSELRCLGLA